MNRTPGPERLGGAVADTVVTVLERAIGAARRFGARATIPPDIDPATRATIEAVRELTLTSPERIASACAAVRYVAGRRLAGSIVECGVWRGGSTIAMLRTLLELGDTGRDVYLYDTFEGMSEPTELDRTFRGQSAATLMSGSSKAAEDVKCIASLEDVTNNVTSSGYPLQRVTFVRGKVEDTIPGTIPQEIAILRLDTDWYESTRHELAHLYPRLVPGGVLIIDDYGHWEGARRAVDEFLAQLPQPLLLTRIDYTGRIAIKN